MTKKAAADEPTKLRLHRTVVRSLPVRLTDEELLKKGQELAATVQDIAAEESRQVDIKTQLKAKLAELDARRSGLAVTVSRKEEHRDVEVDIFYDYQRGVVEDIRRDTGEVLTTRVMQESERQQKLPVETVGA
jgi:hypothetical protein